MQIPTDEQIASRARVLLTLAAGLAATALMLIVVLRFAQGETATHARLHLASSATVMAAAAAVALLWRKPRRRIESLTRTALIVTLCVLGSAQLTEAAGALAWASDGETLERPDLANLHAAATLVGAAALISVAASTVASLGALASRLIPLPTATSNHNERHS